MGLLRELRQSDEWWVVKQCIRSSIAAYQCAAAGDVVYVNQTNATNLAYVDPLGHAIIKVDNTTFVPYNDKRNSVSGTTTSTSTCI